VYGNEIISEVEEVILYEHLIQCAEIDPPNWLVHSLATLFSSPLCLIKTTRSLRVNT